MLQIMPRFIAKITKEESKLKNNSRIGIQSSMAIKGKIISNPLKREIDNLKYKFLQIQE